METKIILLPNPNRNIFISQPNVNSTTVTWKIWFCIYLAFSLITFFANAQTDSVPSVSKLTEFSLEDLMNIKVVTASNTEQKISEAPSTMLVITAQQIKERGYELLQDVLADIPGVDMIHIYGQAPTFITFRGMYGDENRRALFMVDGIVENSIMGTFEVPGAAYSLQNVERIEIIWGPGSALYGANAFSAVINIITKKGAAINGLQYQKAYGSYNTSIDNVMLGIKKSNIELMLSGSLYSTDGPLFANRHPQYNNSYIKNAYSFNGNISYTLKKFKATFGARAYQTPGGTGELAASPTNLLGLASQGNETKGTGGMMQSDFNGEKASFVETFARTAFLTIDYTPNSKLTLSVKGHYRETGLSDKSYVYISFPGTNVVRRNIIAYYANRFKGEVSANYAFNEHHILSAGVQYSEDDLERGLRGVIADTHVDTISTLPVTNLNATFKPREHTIQKNVGAYLQYALNTNFLGKTNLTLGGRYDNNSVYGTTINPRVGLINQPHKTLTIKLLFGTAFRAPTNFELYTIGGARIANPDLKPERIQTYEANLIYTPVKILLVQANVFLNNLTDVIVQDVPINNGANNQNQNVGSVTTKGIECKLDLIPSKTFSAFLNFTYQEGTQNDGTIETNIPNIPHMKGNGGITLHFAQLINISLIENWVGIRSVAPTNPLGRVGEYFITNLVISTPYLFKERVSASITVRNLFNRTYYDPGIRSADGNFYATVNNQPGINGLFKIAVRIF